MEEEKEWRSNVKSVRARRRQSGLRVEEIGQRVKARSFHREGGEVML